MKYNIALPAFVVVSYLGMALACVAPKPVYKAPKPQPCVTHAAITFSPILVKINFDASYTMKDINGARGFTADYFLETLKAKNYSYQIADGVTPNLIYNITISNDGHDHYGAYTEVRGLGEGYLFSVSLPQEYVTPTKLLDDLATKTNEFVVKGWHSGNCGY